MSRESVIEYYGVDEIKDRAREYIKFYLREDNEIDGFEEVYDKIDKNFDSFFLLAKKEINNNEYINIDNVKAQGRSLDEFQSEPYDYSEDEQIGEIKDNSEEVELEG